MQAVANRLNPSHIVALRRGTLGYKRYKRYSKLSLSKRPFGEAFDKLFFGREVRDYVLKASMMLTLSALSFLFQCRPPESKFIDILRRIGNIDATDFAQSTDVASPSPTANALASAMCYAEVKFPPITNPSNQS